MNVSVSVLSHIPNLTSIALRLYPVVPGNARFANKDTTLPRGGGPDGQSPIFIAKGSICAYSVYAMHRRKDIYGPDAEEFRPERWSPKEGLRPGWGYLPFNGGPRIVRSPEQQLRIPLEELIANPHFTNSV